jgi:methionine-rich copper-binding protein CopC
MSAKDMPGPNHHRTHARAVVAGWVDTKVARLAMVALLLVSAVMISTLPARAHGTLTSACPGRGEVMSVLDSIELRFDDPLDGANAEPPQLLLATNDGLTDVEIGPASIVDTNKLVATVPSSLNPGIYTVRYEALAIDGTLYDGGYQFTYDPTATNPGNCIAQSGGSGATMWLVVSTGAVALLALTLWTRTRSARNSARGSRSSRRREQRRRK